MRRSQYNYEIKLLLSTNAFSLVVVPVVEIEVVLFKSGFLLFLGAKFVSCSPLLFKNGFQVRWKCKMNNLEEFIGVMDGNSPTLAEYIPQFDSHVEDTFRIRLPVVHPIFASKFSVTFV